MVASERSGEKRFESDEEVEEHVRKWLSTRSQIFYEQELFKLRSRMGKACR